MAELSYRQEGLILRMGGTATAQQIKDLQRDLRRLGYLRQGIDGAFGPGTTQAVKALQHDLLTNDGSSGAHNDGAAPVSLKTFNRGVTAVTGEADQKLVESISAILDEARIPALPSSNNPEADNRKVLDELERMPPGDVPTAFLLAILKQESGLQHFHVPSGDDTDSFITIGLDHNAGEDYIITSRGYGAGQYTLFHHPPTTTEVNDFMLDPAKNVQRASSELRAKFDHFVNGGTPGTTADDRIGEFGAGPLRACKFSSGDPRFQTACGQCLVDAGSADIVANVTPLFSISQSRYQPTPLRSSFTKYSAVPVRGRIGCDWPYAVRRYNGSGMDSYHYQAQVLLNLKQLAPVGP